MNENKRVPTRRKRLFKLNARNTIIRVGTLEKEFIALVSL